MVTMGNTWDRTTEFVGEHAPALLPIALIGMLVPAIVTAVIGTYAAVPGQLAPGWVFVGWAANLLSLWGVLAMTALVLDPGARTGGAVAVGTRRLLPALGVYLLLGLALLVLMIPLFVLTYLSGIDWSQVSMANGMQVRQRLAGGYGLPILVYLTAIMIALVVVFTRLAPISGVIVAERRGAGALTQAWRRTRGMTWRLIGVLILYIVVVGISTSAVQFVFGSVFGLVLGSDAPVTTAAVLTAIAGAIVSTIFTVLLTVFCAQVYLATRDRTGDARA